MLDHSAIRSHVEKGDSVAIFGAGTGMASFCFRVLEVRSLILVEKDPCRVEAIRRSYTGENGVIHVQEDPNDVLPIVSRFRPTAALLDLRGAEVSPKVVAQFAYTMDSLEVLGIVYQKPGSDRVRGMEEFLATWDDREDYRWQKVYPSTGVMALYVR